MSKSKRSNKGVYRKRTQDKPIWKQSVFWIVAGLAVAAAFFFVTLASPAGGDQAPSFEAVALTGDTINLSDYEGQVVMLNFWATWCPPCRAEMPAIQSAYSERHDEGFMVLAINASESAETIAPFVQMIGMEFPVLMDLSGRLQRQFAIQSYPTSIFIDGTGQVYAQHSGMLNETQLQDYIDQGIARNET